MNELKDKFSKMRILVIGDIMLDRYIFGDVSRISPEAPVPVVEINNEIKKLGGAANVIHNLVTLGSKPLLCGIVGADVNGGEILRELDKLDVDIRPIIIDADRPTTVKTRLIGNGHQIVRFDNESRENIGNNGIDSVVSFVKDNIEHVDGIIISDYDKGVISYRLMSEIFNTITERKFIVSDPHKNNFESHKYVNLITPNKDEVSAFCGFSIKNDKDMEFAVKKIFHKLVCGSVLITEGKDGMTLFEGDKKSVHIPTAAKEIFDVSGAGDTVISTICLAISSGMDLESSVRLANSAAGVVVGKIGTATISIDELEKEVL